MLFNTSWPQILIIGVAPLAAPLLGGQILAYGSWRAIFWVLVAFGVLALAALCLLPETLAPGQRGHEPLRGALSGYLVLLREPRILGYALSGGFFYAGVYAFIVGTLFVYTEYYHVSPQAYWLLFAVNIAGIVVANFVNSCLLARLGS